MIERYRALGLLNVPDKDGCYVTYSDHEAEIDRLNSQIVQMRKECNKRFSEQLQKIRKLEAVNMLQSQNNLFDDCKK